MTTYVYQSKRGLNMHLNCTTTMTPTDFDFDDIEFTIKCLIKIKIYHEIYHQNIFSTNQTNKKIHREL